MTHFVCEGIHAILYYGLDQHKVAMCHRFPLIHPIARDTVTFFVKICRQRGQR